jgi:hypothetical protein
VGRPGLGGQAGDPIVVLESRSASPTARGPPLRLGLNLPPLVVCQVFPGVVLHLMLIHLFDVVCAARLPHPPNWVAGLPHIVQIRAFSGGLSSILRTFPTAFFSFSLLPSLIAMAPCSALSASPMRACCAGYDSANRDSRSLRLRRLRALLDQCAVLDRLQFRDHLDRHVQGTGNRAPALRDFRGLLKFCGLALGQRAADMQFDPGDIPVSGLYLAGLAGPPFSRFHT